MTVQTGIGPISEGFFKVCIRGLNPVTEGCNALHIAPMLTTGTAELGKVARVFSGEDAAKKFGHGSVAHIMAITHFNETYTPLSVLPYEDGGTKAQYQIALGATPESGAFSFKFEDKKFNIPVDDTDTLADIAEDVAEAINLVEYLPFTAQAVGGDIGIEFKNGGEVGNHMMIVFNPDLGDEFPGITAVFSQITQGAGDPDIEPILPALGRCRYMGIAVANSDMAHIDPVYSWVKSKWVCGVDQVFGHLLHHFVDSVDDVITYAENYNHRHRSISFIPEGTKWNKYMPWRYSAYHLGVQCRGLATNKPYVPIVRDLSQSRSLTLPFECSASDLTITERAAIVNAGLTLLDVNQSGYIFIDTNRTNYKYNVSGDRDDTFIYTEDMYKNMYYADLLRMHDYQNFQNVGLVADGADVPVGAQVVTPTIYKASLKNFLEQQTGWAFDPLDEEFIHVQLDKQGFTGDKARLNVCTSPRFPNSLLRIAHCVNNDTTGVAA